MNLSQLMHRSQRMLSDNSPLILTTLGVVGTCATAYYTAKATFRAADVILREERDRRIKQEPVLTPKERIELVWKLYMPAAGVMTLSCTAIVFANRISTRRTVAMAAAYTISERAYSEYKEKVVQQLGKSKEGKIREELAQERVARADKPANVMIATDDGQVLCHDAFSNQYFKSDMESLRRAQNDVNAQILHADSATVSDFYHYVGSPELQPTSVSGDLGWNTDKLLELDFHTVLHNDRTPCISIDFAVVPIRDPWRFR